MGVRSLWTEQGSQAKVLPSAQDFRVSVALQGLQVLIQAQSFYAII